MNDYILTEILKFYNGIQLEKLKMINNLFNQLISNYLYSKPLINHHFIKIFKQN